MEQTKLKKEYDFVRSIIANGDNRCYWYNIHDLMILLIHLRKRIISEAD
jgi:hypothetical protein